jgi:hypothetical protein
MTRRCQTRKITIPAGCRHNRQPVTFRQRSGYGGLVGRRRCFLPPERDCIWTIATALERMLKDDSKLNTSPVRRTSFDYQIGDL